MNTQSYSPPLSTLEKIRLNFSNFGLMTNCNKVPSHLTYNILDDSLLRGKIILAGTTSITMDSW